MLSEVLSLEYEEIDLLHKQPFIYHAITDFNLFWVKRVCWGFYQIIHKYFILL